MRQPWFTVLVREWPLVAAALGIASLALLPRFVRSEERIREREHAVIEEIRRRVGSDPKEAEALAREFIETRATWLEVGGAP